MAWHAIELIQPGIDKTLAFFKGPGLFSKWVKLGLLIFVFSILSGGTGNNFSYNFNSMEDPQIKEGLSNALSDGTAWLAGLSPETINAMIIWAMVAVVVLFAIGVLLTILKNMCFFAILESASTDKVKIIPYLKKFFKKAFSLAFIEIIFCLISLPFLLILLLALVSFFSAIFGFSLDILGPLAGIASNPLLMALLVLISLIALIALAIAGYVLDQFAAYWMYLKEISAWEAFKKSLSLAGQNLEQVIVLILMQIVLVIAAALISILVAILIAIPFIIIGIVLALILVPLMQQSAAMLAAGIAVFLAGIFIFVIIASIILAPVSFFFFNYNLMFLKKLLPAKKN